MLHEHVVCYHLDGGSFFKTVPEACHIGLASLLCGCCTCFHPSSCGGEHKSVPLAGNLKRKSLHLYCVCKHSCRCLYRTAAQYAVEVLSNAGGNVSCW